ncbi:MAG: DUF5060 domain-containing protein [Bacteroidia bacterium]|nr:DUF5060 domain-containing protein [Bacteroidia bacterium]
MPDNLARFIIATFLITLIPIMSKAQPVILSLDVESNTVEQFGKFQANVSLSGTYTNPYDYDQVRVYCLFTGPNNEQIEVDGFFMEDYSLQDNGSLRPEGEGFKIRFSPNQPGTWTYQLSVQDVSGIASQPPGTFTVVPPGSDLAKGIIKTGSSNYLEFANGDQYIPIGENMCWQNNNPYIDYRTWLDSLAAHGGNFFRLWHAHWGLGIEWKNNWNGFSGLRNYLQANARYQDWLYDYSAEKGIYVMLCLQHHGPVSTQVNPNWSDSPYNAANGGPCQNPWDFFTNSSAIAHTKNRFRYIVARWGYARSIMAWELFNEAEWTDNYEQYKIEVMEWHAEMAAYLKSIDPYGHLVTTSFAKEENDPLVWANADMDFTQTHHYVAAANLERVLVTSSRSYLENFQKPTINGEFGNGLSKTLSTADPGGIHIHNSLWASLMGGGLGTAMSWWWDIYIHPSDPYYHFGAIAKLAERIPFAKGNLSPGKAHVSNAPGDLTLTTSGGWGTIAQNSIDINPDGTTTPTNPGLGTYLYGSQFNTQFRSPPVFSVHFPSAGSFTVRTASAKSRSPKIAIWVDGIKMIDKSAGTNQDFTVKVDAGFHYIKVDNTGADWITISSYSFAGLGAAADSYVLVSANGKLATGWVLHAKYNYLHVPQNGVPAPLHGAVLNIEGLEDSLYYLKWYDCLTGDVIANEAVSVTDGKLAAAIPPLVWDLAFVLDRVQEIPVTGVQPADVALSIYPNPAKRGDWITISMPQFSLEEMEVALLDMSGRLVSTSNHQRLSRIEFPVPAYLSAGVYFCRISTAREVSTLPLVIQD